MILKNINIYLALTVALNVTNWIAASSELETAREKLCSLKNEMVSTGVGNVLMKMILKMEKEPLRDLKTFAQKKQAQDEADGWLAELKKLPTEGIKPEYTKMVEDATKAVNEYIDELNKLNIVAPMEIPE